MSKSARGLTPRLGGLSTSFLTAPKFESKDCGIAGKYHPANDGARNGKQPERRYNANLA